MALIYPKRAWHSWYKTALWQARRQGQLAAHPTCERCKARGKIVAAVVANHRIPHRGDWALFSEGDLQSLCKPCHDGPTQREEKTGMVLGCDTAGRPSDARHPWNR